MHINAYYNGVFTNRDEVRISLTDRAVFFGDGIYDAAIGANGKIFMLDDHVDRFFTNAKTLDIPVSMTKDELKSILLFLAGTSPHKCYFVYFQLTRFSEERVHSYPDTSRSNLLVTVTDQEPPRLNKRLKLTLAKDIRHEMCNVKTLNLIPSILASHKAVTQGCDEAVLHRNGTVTECAHSNVHIVSNGVIITHPLDNHILPGISRKHMLSVCKRLGISVIERAFSVYELYKADEVLVSSSSKLVAIAESIGNIVFPPQKSGIGELICREMTEDFIKFTKNNTTNC